MTRVAEHMLQHNSPIQPSPIAFLVDDDASVLRSLQRLLVGAGFNVRSFNSPAAFLDDFHCDTLGCLVLDMEMPGLSGLELQQALAARGCVLPIVFLTAHGDVPMTVKALKRGAVDFLTKPVEHEDLLSAIEQALEHGRALRQARDELVEIQARLATLTAREHEVLSHVVAGRLNKQTAAELGIAEKTIKVHRARVMEKMHARSLADLVRFAERAGIRLARTSADKAPVPIVAYPFDAGRGKCSGVSRLRA